MLNKIKLYIKIKKFYRTYGSELGPSFIDSLADITNNNLYDVQFDINDVLEAYKDCFYEEAYEINAELNKLNIQIQNFREGNTNKFKHSKAIILTSILVALATVGGYTIGKHNTIKSAELHNITDNGYDISFGDEVHNYTFEEEVR